MSTGTDDGDSGSNRSSLKENSMGPLSEVDEKFDEVCSLRRKDKGFSQTS